MLIFTCLVVVIVCGALAATREYMMALLQLTELHIFFIGVFLVANGGKALTAAVIIFRQSDKNTGRGLRPNMMCIHEIEMFESGYYEALVFQNGSLCRTWRAVVL